jgi:phage gpG-like protein
MTAFKIDIADGQVTAGLRRVIEAGRDPSPALRAIGEAFYGIARQTFETSTDPWGRRWQPNAEATLVAYLERKSGAFAKRDGRLTQKGAGHAMAKKPLIGDGRFLSGASLFYQVQGNELTVGSSAIYAAMQHFGGGKAEFPHLWGDIPARPFLPIDAAGNLAPAAEREAVEIVQEYLLGAWG